MRKVRGRLAFAFFHESYSFFNAANFDGQFTLHRSGSPHVLDSLSWPVLMTKSAESKVRFLEVRLCQRALVGEGLESAVYDVLSSLNGIRQKESNSIHLLLDGFGTVKEEGSEWAGPMDAMKERP